MIPPCQALNDTGLVCSNPLLGISQQYIHGKSHDNEDRCTISKGHGPKHTCLRRFATGLIKSTSKDSVASTIEQLARNVRRVFDYLRMTGNS